MVRCEEFYIKWIADPNFCDKHEVTANGINSYIITVRRPLCDEIAESEILRDKNVEIARIISEKASRPLISEESPEIRKEAIKQIAKIAEEKVMDDKPPRVTEKEVKQVVETIKQRPEFKSAFNITNDNIEWAKYSWNPVTGCKLNCKYCYARDIANRFYDQGFEPTFHENRLDAPKNTQLIKDTLPNVFVCSMADLFGEWVSQDWIDKVMNSVRNNPQWNFLFLTKNPGRLPTIDWSKNSWVGATVDIQSRVIPTINALKQVKSSVRFVSCEPLQESIVFDEMPFEWLIIGGRSQSSGMIAGQPKWEWVESLLMQARKNNVKVYFKPNLEVRPKEYPE